MNPFSPRAHTLFVALIFYLHSSATVYNSWTIEAPCILHILSVYREPAHFFISSNSCSCYSLLLLYKHIHTHTQTTTSADTRRRDRFLGMVVCFRFLCAQHAVCILSVHGVCSVCCVPTFRFSLILKRDRVRASERQRD